MYKMVKMYGQDQFAYCARHGKCFFIRKQSVTDVTAVTVPPIQPTGTAVAGQDYDSSLVPLTLQPPTGATTTDRFCVSWPIIDDRRVEQEECFGVTVVSGDEGAHSTLVFGSPVNATVCIEDDDKGVCVCVRVVFGVCTCRVWCVYMLCVVCVHDVVYMCVVCVCMCVGVYMLCVVCVHVVCGVCT